MGKLTLMNTRIQNWLLVITLVMSISRSAYGNPIGPDFTRVSEAVLPTTVHIRIERGPLIAAGIQQMARDYAIPVPRHDAEGVRQSTGSGVIFDERGLVLTNHHVINGAKEIRVTLYDQTSFEATVLGSDPRTDVAVLRIQGKGPFPAAIIGDSEEIRVGQWVIAVGHPFDFPFTVTAGIISALGRRNLGKNEIQDYIQTDVAVNPGSSGGPLFNTDGLVVGINTAIFSPDKENLANAGISFAIPSRMAIQIAQQLAERGAVAYAGIGVSTEDESSTQNDPRPGAKITQVQAGSPAESAGLRRGDVIVSVNGEPTATSLAFQSLVIAQAVGTKLAIRHKRGNKTRLIHVKTVDASTIGSSAPLDATNATLWRGMHLVDANEKNLSQRGISLPKDVPSGVLITAIEPDSPADLAGLLPGDVLLKAQKSSIAGVDDLLKTVENKRVVMISFWRGKSQYLAAVANRVQPG